MFGKILNKKTPKNKEITKGEIVLILDIRSSSVGGGLIKNFEGRGKAPLILDTYREKIFFDENIDANLFIKKTENALNKVLAEITYKKNTYGKIEKVHIFYGAPWFKSCIKNIDIKEEKTIEFNEEYLKKILNKDQKETQITKTTEIEKDLIYKAVNGYFVKKVFGKKIKNINICFYESMVHTDTQKGFEDIIEKHMNVRKILFHTLPLSIFKVLEDKFETFKNYTILDISGEITEISIIRDKKFQKIISIPKGTHYFVREFAKKSKSDLRSAFLKLDNIFEKDTETDLNNENYPFYIDIKRSWLDSIKEIIDGSQTKSMPADVFILTDESTKNIVQDILNDVEVYSGILKFGRKPNIYFINSAEISNLCFYRQSVIKDPIISLEANFVEVTE
jgi:hypothetical protein